MAVELSMFNQYKEKLDTVYDKNPQPNVNLDVFLFLNKTGQLISNHEFYTFSFQSRPSAELDYKLLGAVLKDAVLTPEQQARARYYLNHTKYVLHRDAELAGNTYEAKRYQDENSAPEIDAPGSWQYKKLGNDWANLLRTPKEINKVIGWISFLNIYRLIATFARLSWTMLWEIAAQCHLLDDNNALFGYRINRDLLTASTTFFNALSVLLFVGRWTSHIAMILKHVACPTDAEKAIRPLERGVREFYGRMSHILNDTVWGIINLLTNYPQLWGMSVATANIVIACAILFDLTWLCAQWAFKEWELYDKRKELDALSAVLSPDAAEINRQMLLKLDDEQLEMRARFIIQILACLLIIGSFVSVMTFTAAAVAPIGFLACMIGFSIYLSSDEFATYWRSFYAHDRRNSTESSVQKEQQEARIVFFKTLSKAALVPTLLVGMYTISWPVALVLSVLYAAYENYGPKPELDISDEPLRTSGLVAG